MLILGIDPGTATTGFGLVKITDSGNPVLVHHGLIETDKDGDPGLRLSSIFRQMAQIIEEHKPHVMAMEKIFFFSNAKTVIRVSQAQGVLLLAAAHSHIPVFEYAPGQVKLNIGGNGRADKKMVQQAVKEMFGVTHSKTVKKTHFDNAADAIAIAVCHGKFVTGNQVLPQSQVKKSKTKEAMKIKKS